MTIPQLPERSLRIGLLTGGEVQTELLASTGRPVTLGSAGRNDLVAPGLRRREVLFEPQGDGFALVVRPGMSGRVALSSGVFDLQGAPGTPRGEARLVALDTQSRGRITVGGHTVLFQFVLTPPQAARPAVDFRPPLLGESDQTFAGFLATFSAAAVAFLSVAAHTPIPSEVDLAAAPERIIERVLLDTAPLPKPQVEERTAPTTEARASRRQPDPTPERRRIFGGRSDDQPTDHRSVRDRVADSRFFQAIVGTHGAAGRDDLFNGSDTVGAQLAGDLTRVQGFDNTASLSSRPDVSGPGGREDQTVGDLGRSGPGGDTHVGGPTGGASVRVRGGDPTHVGGSGGSDLDEDVRRRIHSYSGAVQRCYESALLHSPELSGRVVLSLSLASGRVNDAVVTENTTGSQDLALCIESRALGWRFDPAATLDFLVPFALSKG